ncbi:hypothetical protein [Moorena sp. SIO3I6]|uniref:hypothetical protein n=1 Tax=Moorena sp. SIO3I6 TaxID=2607831 RepID=UPI0013FA27B0|nr:hypothetical protein [Moorena sp. SIO3I6]NEP26535.1 hypothetical protein [Moorena sp. SIO3I6]
MLRTLQERLRTGARYAPEAFRQSRRYANAKRGHSRSVAFWPRPQLPRLCDRTKMS